MANYDFQNLLSPLDFEHLVKDLLSAELKMEFTTFASGKDGGVDLRYSKNGDSNIVVQCKRVKYIGKKTLTEEAEKLKKLNPDKYYFVTSSELSVAKTDQIREIFEDWIDSDEYIYSREKLNTLIDKHKDVHQKHYKLWLNSSNIFNSLINQHLFERAKSLINSITNSYKYYVRNDSIKEAIKILNESQFLIISGIPGIGKTTLAKLLLWEYLQKDFEVIEIRKVIEGEQILIEESETKQVFYFDDFLGENFLKYDVIEGRSYDLVQFIQRIMNNKNKILIMTTREYILNQAKEKYEKLDTSELNIYKYTLDLNNYTKRIKTLILYNHLYYSKISDEHIKNIIQSKAYKSIINHKNYSPRIIEQMTIKLNKVKPDVYSETFIDNLDNPFGIWDRAFKAEISEGSKYTLYILLSIGRAISLNDLKKALKYFFNQSAKKHSLDFRPIDFKNYLKELEGSFIKIDITDKSKHYVDFQNPSIKDFLIKIVRANEDIIKMIINSSYFFNQLVYTINYLSKNINHNKEVKKLIASNLIDRYNQLENSSSFYSSYEYKNERKDIDIIDNLKNYILAYKNKPLRKFLIKKFEKIEIENLYAHDEKKYIDFYSDFKNDISLSFNYIINKLYNNISWLRNIKNFLLLKNISDVEFKEFVTKNIDSLDDKFVNAIKQDIEFTDSESSLDDLIFELDNEIESLSLISKYDYSSLKLEIKEKIDSISMKDDEEIEELDSDIEISEEDIDEELVFDEEEFFKIEMFK
ncbi:restriction endonuclease [Tenacibaculum sp.]|uniref:nSTAND3 domain-containing NTPase n=1 Tax=Tenacibaculum sp. TaxID=1906242 RepID=UPI003D0F8C86